MYVEKNLETNESKIKSFLNKQIKIIQEKKLNFLRLSNYKL